MSTNVRYEIEEVTNAVKVFYDNSDVPSLFQPHWPNGQGWENAAEAAAWAELYIASIVDETAPYAPHGRGETGAAKPTPAEIAEAMDAIKLKYNNP